MALSTAHATRSLARAHGWALLQTLRAHVREKRLLCVTIVVFLLGYASTAYLLVAKGLEFVNRMPILGPMLTERIVYVLFFFFFAMLVVSNATITGMGLFRRRETGWLLSLPLSFRSLVLWQTFEAMLVASWGLLLLSAPILAAIGHVLESPRAFYLHALPAMLCLITIAANASTWLLLAIMRWVRREWLKPIGLIGLAAIVVTAIVSWPSAMEPGKSADVAASVGTILQHSDHFAKPMLPSSWVAEAVLAAGRGEGERAGFYGLILLAWALASMVITAYVACPLFYPAWTRSLQPWVQRRRTHNNCARAAWPWWLNWLPIGSIDRALMQKDVRTFLREPAQWGQSVLVFGLLFLYTANLRRIVFDYRDPFWTVVTSYLNLLVCGLSLSTLTTRFIFPQISLEGQRLWLFGLSPMRPTRLLDTKLKLTLLVTGVLTTSLTMISCWTLSISWERTAFFLVCILLLTVGLNMMALGLGTIFPDFRETNPAKVVSGFGGTICLIASFVYIASALAVALIPAWPELRPGMLHFDGLQRLRLECFSSAGLVVLTFLFGGLPYWLAKRKIICLEFFRGT